MPIVVTAEGWIRKAPRPSTRRIDPTEALKHPLAYFACQPIAKKPPIPRQLLLPAPPVKPKRGKRIVSEPVKRHEEVVVIEEEDIISYRSPSPPPRHRRHSHHREHHREYETSTHRPHHREHHGEYEASTYRPHHREHHPQPYYPPTQYHAPRAQLPRSYNWHNATTPLNI